MRSFLLTITIVLIAISACSQVQQAWVARANGIENKNESGGLIGRDAVGYIYVAGSRYGSADVENDGFLTIKYNPINGSVVWAHVNNDAGPGGPWDMCVDAAGNVYVTGGSGPTSQGSKWYTFKYNTNGVLHWGHTYTNSANGEGSFAIAVDGAGNTFVTGYSYTDAGYRSVTTMKYDAAGNRKWIKYFYGTDHNARAAGDDIAVDASGNVYVTGHASYLETGRDIVLLKYNNEDGTLLASNRYDGLLDDESSKIVVDASGNIYVTGKTSISGHDADILALKYNSNCEVLWERLYNGSLNRSDWGNDIGVDAAGNVFVTGYTTVNLSGDDRDQILTKYDANGTKLWENIFTITPGLNNISTALALDGFGNAYITGYSGEIGGRTAPVDYVTLKFNPSGVQQWMQTYNGPAGLSDDAENIIVDPLGNVFVSGTSARTENDFDIATIKYSQCNIICPSNIEVNAGAGKCDAIVTFADVTTTGDCGATLTYSHTSGFTFPVGTTTVTVTSTETGATCTFDIVVVDNQNPVINYCPPSKSVNMGTGVCYATAASVNAGAATATDNCSVTVEGTRSDGQPLTANYPGGITTITWTATDPSGNTAVCTQTITVVDNEPPVVTGEVASTYLLSPPNHTMRDVAIDYIISDNCPGVDTTITVTSNEPVNGTGDGDTDPDWVIVDKKNLKLRAERSANGNGRIYTITITATDGSGNSTVKTLEVHVPHNIKKPNSGQPFRVGSTVSFLGEFWDRPGNRHTAKWLIDGSTTAKAVVTEPSGTKNGTVTGSYKFTSPGVYKLQMSVTDQTGVTHQANTAGDLDAIVVIYDPNGGHTYGGGYFNSPAGALRSNPAATGKAGYGFAMNYFKNSTNPKGETQFEFKVGDFEFNALNFEYLVINNTMAQFRGTGKIIGGQSGIGFTMTVVDGQLDGTGVDKIRMKIYNKNNGLIIYDNQPGASDAALPTQAVGANSEIVIKGSGKNEETTNKTSSPMLQVSTSESELAVVVYPNPAGDQFSAMISTADRKQTVSMEVYDMYGRLVEIRTNIAPGSIIRFGEMYKAGIYLLRILQGERHKEIKLIKQ